MQQIKERISGIDDMIKKIKTSFKENVQYKQTLSQSCQKIWDIIKRPNLKIIEIKKRGETKLKGPENILIKIIKEEENFLN